MIIAGSHTIVTGGSSGIGRATVELLASAGARVSVIALDDADMERLAAEPPRGAHPVHLVAADVSRREQVEAAVAACVSSHGPCSILVTSAGVVMPGYFEALPVEEFERQMLVNYLGTLYPIKAVVGPMIEARRGAIVCISSAAGLLGVFGYSAYGPTKYAVRGLCEVLRSELRPHGVAVSCVFPSDVDTPQLAGERPHQPRELKAVAGAIKAIPPARVAAAIAEGIRTGKPLIYPEVKTRVLARMAGTMPGFTRSYLDRVVTRSRRRHRA